jgi:hypothetical protein
MQKYNNIFKFSPKPETNMTGLDRPTAMHASIQLSNLEKKIPNFSKQKHFILHTSSNYQNEWLQEVTKSCTALI